MAKISWIVFIIIGALFSIGSHIVNNMQENDSLTIFIYIGYLFIGYGVAKLVVVYILGKNNNVKDAFDDRLPENGGMPKIESSKDIKRNYNNIPSNKNDFSNNNSSKNSLYGYIGYCSRCATPMRNLNRYCHRCGLRQEEVK
jgi:hypothetical protein